ncbi:MAG: hypothetical protein JRI94_16490 [Deltaproteobacteria bacterium]|nr:hypothetical protein [Deltaproteobacteria bacterium]MBW2115436.1 hypothetical protein [Deltaproteobacteria bacterium]
MGKTKLQNDFVMLRDHCIIIRRDYNTYNDLFFSGSDDLLIKAASTFFNDIAEIMQRDWILQVCKLVDPAVTKRKGTVLENISIDLINSQLENEGLMCQEISCISDALIEYGKKIVPARNKRLAHLDRDHQISRNVLGATTEEELEVFLENIQKYCDAVGRAIGLGPLDFTDSSCPGDVHDLLRVLRDYYKDA